MTEQLSFKLDASAGKPIQNIYYGTCSWTDPTLIQSRAFYPTGVSSAEERLRFYAQSFPLMLPTPRVPVVLSLMTENG